MIEYTRLLPVADHFNAEDETTLYWRKGNSVYFRHHELRGADPETFGFYIGYFGRDKNKCFCTNSHMKNANASTFCALNYCYFTDRQTVWNIFGVIKNADGSSFEVLDDGALHGLRSKSQFGYGKDKNGVFYTGLYGHIGWLKEPDLDSIQSCGDGHFAYDKNQIFFGKSRLPKCHRATWRKLAGLYSRDADSVFYGNKKVANGDADSFHVIEDRFMVSQIARDKNYFFRQGLLISEAEFEAENSRLNSFRTQS